MTRAKGGGTGAPKQEVYARRLARGSAAVFAGIIITGFIALLLKIFLARSLGAADYGLLCASFAFVSLFAALRDLGVPAAVVKHLPQFAVRGRFGAMKSTLGFAAAFEACAAFAIGVLLFVLSDGIAVGVFAAPGAAPVIRILSAWFFAETLIILCASAFQGLQDMRAYAVTQFSPWGLTSILAVALVGGLGLGVGAAAAAYALGFAIAAAGCFALLRARAPRVFAARLSITRRLAKRLLLFAVPLILAAGSGVIIYHIDTVMIGALRTIPEVGLYQAAHPLMLALTALPTALCVALMPMASEMWERRHRELLGRALGLVTKLTFAATLMVAVAFIAFPETILLTLFGTGYVAAAPALQILSAAAVACSLYAILTVAIVGVGRPWLHTRVILAMAGFDIVGNAALIPSLGIAGAALATLATFAFGLALTARYARRLVGFSTPLGGMANAALGACLVTALALVLKTSVGVVAWPAWLGLVVIGLPCLALYALWVLVAGTVTRGDVALLEKCVSLPRWLSRALRRLTG